MYGIVVLKRKFAMHVQPHTPTDIATLKSKARAEKNAKQRDRYRAVAMALEGFSTEHIMYILSRSRNFVQRWAYFYRDGGIETISPRLQTGRPAKLACESAGDFKQRIVAGPTTVDNGLCTLRGKDAMRILQQEFGVKYSLSSVYALMHRLGLSCLKPRPRHRHNDPAAMQQWLEEAPLLSTQSSRKTRTKKSKSGSRMKPGSASKGH
jgi:transposase